MDYQLQQKSLLVSYYRKTSCLRGKSQETATTASCSFFGWQPRERVFFPSPSQTLTLSLCLRLRRTGSLVFLRDRETGTEDIREREREISFATILVRHLKLLNKCEAVSSTPSLRVSPVGNDSPQAVSKWLMSVNQEKDKLKETETAHDDRCSHQENQPLPFSLLTWLRHAPTSVKIRRPYRQNISFYTPFRNRIRLAKHAFSLTTLCWVKTTRSG